MPAFFWRLFLTLWLTIIGFTILVGATYDALNRNLGVTEILQRSEAQAIRLAERIAQAIQENDSVSARRLLRRAPALARNMVLVFDSAGTEVLGRNPRRYARFGFRKARLVETVTTGGETYQIKVLQHRASGFWALTSRGQLWRLAVALVLSALVSYVLARWLAAPIQTMRQATRSLAAGNLQARVGQPLTARKDEFGLLANDFDSMAEHLARMYRANRRLLRDVSHELRSPLARSQVALELARAKDSGAVRSELDRIELENQRLEHLIDQVLVLLRHASVHEELDRQPINLEHLLQDLAESLQYEFREVGIDLQTTPVSFDGNRELLWRALENLLRNACRYTEPDQGIQVCLGSSTDQIELTIRDHGPGIPDTDLPHIFEPFYRVHDARDRDSGGYGVGLAIAATAVDRHAGELAAENHPAGGLLVRLSLPLG